MFLVLQLQQLFRSSDCKQIMFLIKAFSQVVHFSDWFQWEKCPLSKLINYRQNCTTIQTK